MTQDIQREPVEFINHARVMLLVFCFGISAAAVLLVLWLMKDIVLDMPGSLGDYLTVVLFILTGTATGQIYFNERLLRPLRMYLAPSPGEPKGRKKWKPISAAALLFGVWIVIISLTYISILVISKRGFSFYLYLALALGTGLVVSGVFYILKRSEEVARTIPLGNAVDALLKLPLSSAFFSLAMWVIAGVLIYLGFHHLVGMSVRRSFNFFVVSVSAGCLAFPLQYFLFKRVIEPLGEFFKWEDVFERGGGFRFFIRQKLLISMGSLTFFAVGFFGVLSYNKANRILKLQTEQFLGRLVARIAADASKSGETAAIDKLESLAELYGAEPLVIDVKDKVVATHLQAPRHRDIAEALIDGDEERVKKLRGDDLLIIRSTGNDDIKWGLLYPYENLAPALSGIRNKSLLFGVLILMIAAGLAILASRDVSRPLEMLSEEALTFSGGDYDRRFGFLTDDETADLALGFRMMSEEIKRQMKKISELIENIEITVHHLGTSAGELEAIARQQAAGSAQQAAAVQEALTTAGEIAATAKQIAENALTVHNVATESQNACMESSVVVSSTIGGVEEVREHVNTVAYGTIELSRLSLQIGGIVDIIEEINEQTNLLSVNASIEASGAGDEGKRFAVLAKELRRLNEGIVDATDQIRALVERIRKSTTSTVMMAEESTKVVDSWASQVQKLGEAFSNISAFVELASSATGEIRTSTNQQTTACEQMAQVIAEVKEVADQVVISSRETEKSMADLAELTTSLRELVRVSGTASERNSNAETKNTDS